MLKLEWKNLLKNKLLLLVIAAVILIPTIYTTLFLGYMWDPYGKVEKLPVAVVNEDVPASYGDTQLSIGSSLVEELKTDHSLHFLFTDRKTAEKGLKDGRYYMTITIPADFSKNAATIMTDTPRQMELLFHTNPGTNYIASKMGETAMKNLQASVREKVTGTYVRILFDKLTETGKGLHEAADGADRLENGMAELGSGNQSLSDNLRLLSSRTLTFRNGAYTFKEGLDKYMAGVSQAADGSLSLSEGAGRLASGMDSLQTKSAPLAAGVQQLDKGASALASGTKKASESGAAITAGTQALDSRLGDLCNGLATLKSQALQLPSAAQTFSSNMEKAVAGADTLAKETDRLAAGTDKLSAASQAVSEGLKAVTGENHATSQALSYEATKLRDSLSALADDAAKETGSSSPVGFLSYFPDMGNTLTSMNNDSASLANASATAKSTAQALSQIDPNADPATLREQLTLAANALSQAGDSLQQGSDSLARAENIRSTLSTATVRPTDPSNPGSSANSSLTPERISALQKQAESLSHHVSAYTAGADQAADGSLALSSHMASLKQGMTAVGTGIHQLHDGMQQLKSASDALANGSSKIVGGIDSAASGSLLLREKGSLPLLQGANALQSGLKTLEQAGSSLHDGAAALSHAFPSFMNGITALKNGSKELEEGSSSLTQGLTRLQASGKELTAGASSLSDGADRISDGSDRLYDGSVLLGKGVENAKEGADTLSSSLKDGASRLTNAGTSGSADLFAAPVTTEETRITSVPDNGHAMAPYMMSVALWVGCIAISLVYPLTKYHGNLRSGTSWWISKASVLFAVALLQAIIMVILLHMIDGFSPVHMKQTLLIACLTSLAFMAIMCFFTTMFGKIGSFLMLIFMVVQLAGSVGTYPLELSGAFVPAIHPFVPFTYTVKAFRSAISGGTDVSGCIHILVGLFILFFALNLLGFTIRASRIKADKKTLIEWLERHRLA